MLRDFRHALRSLRASPGFTTVALLILALGIGASTAVFSVVDAVVLRGLPFDDAGRLMAITSVNAPRVSGPGISQTPQDFADWKQQQDVFESLMATATTTLTLDEGGHPEEVRGQRATATFFSVLRVPPQLGRPFTEANETDGAHRVLVLTDGFWRRRFGANPGVVGTSLSVNGERWEILGVMPRGFAYPVATTRPPDVYVPYVVPENQKVRGNSRNYYLQIVGRLKPGVTEAQAAARIEQITAALVAQYPTWFRERRSTVTSLHETLVGRVRPWMMLLLGAVGFVMLIACVNVANLMLARATSRTREMTVRAALGASRWQLARGLLAESLVLSLLGTIGGVLLALWGVDVLRTALPADLPRFSSIGIDLRVLGAAALAAIATGLLFGIAPAIQFSRPALTTALRDGGRGATTGRTRQALRATLMTVEVALAVVLLVGAGLFMASFARVTGVGLGLDTSHVLSVDVSPRVNYADRKAVDAMVARMGVEMPRLVDRVKAIPGVDISAMIANGLPLSGSWSRTDVRVRGRAEEFRGDDSVDIRQVTPRYHEAVRQRLVRGRYLADGDGKGAPMAVVLNEEAARRYLADREALGALITINSTERTVVGIVGDVRMLGPEQPVRPEAYVPAAQDALFGGELVIRTAGRPEAIIQAVKAAIWEIFPDQVIPEIVTMDQLYARLVAQRRFNMLLVGLFGVLALAIAAAGIYGVMAYIVQQRTQEIGVRMALGARPSGVLLMVLRRAAAFLVAGLVIGGGIAYVLSAKVAGFLFQVQPTDPLVFGVAGGVLLLAGLAAAFVPARRASRVDPLVAIRE